MSLRVGQSQMNCSQINLSDQDAMALQALAEETKGTDLNTIKGRYTNMLNDVLKKQDTALGNQAESAAYMRSVTKYASIFVIVLALLSTTNFALTLRANEMSKETHVASGTLTDTDGQVLHVSSADFWIGPNGEMMKGDAGRRLSDMTIGPNGELLPRGSLEDGGTDRRLQDGAGTAIVTTAAAFESVPVQALIALAADPSAAKAYLSHVTEIQYKMTAATGQQAALVRSWKYLAEDEGVRISLADGSVLEAYASTHKIQMTMGSGIAFNMCGDIKIRRSQEESLATYAGRRLQAQGRRLEDLGNACTPNDYHYGARARPTGIVESCIDDVLAELSESEGIAVENVTIEEVDEAGTPLPGLSNTSFAAVPPVTAEDVKINDTHIVELICDQIGCEDESFAALGNKDKRRVISSACEKFSGEALGQADEYLNQTLMEDSGAERRLVGMSIYGHNCGPKHGPHPNGDAIDAIDYCCLDHDLKFAYIRDPETFLKNPLMEVRSNARCDAVNSADDGLRRCVGDAGCSFECHWNHFSCTWSWNRIGFVRCTGGPICNWGEFVACLGVKVLLMSFFGALKCAGDQMCWHHSKCQHDWAAVGHFVRVAAPLAVEGGWNTVMKVMDTKPQATNSYWKPEEGRRRRGVPKGQGNGGKWITPRRRNLDGSDGTGAGKR